MHERRADAQAREKPCTLSARAEKERTAGEMLARCAASSMPYSVLVVDQHPVVLSTWIAAVLDAGYEVTATTSFHEARHRLAARPPNLLIASSRLGGFNGMHLAMCGQVSRPGMTAIVTTRARDPILEAEASVFGASCVVAPESRTGLLAVVARAFSTRPM